MIVTLLDYMDGTQLTLLPKYKKAVTGSIHLNLNVCAQLLDSGFAQWRDLRASIEYLTFQSVPSFILRVSNKTDNYVIVITQEDSVAVIDYLKRDDV